MSKPGHCKTLRGPQLDPAQAVGPGSHLVCSGSSHSKLESRTLRRFTAAALDRRPRWRKTRCELSVTCPSLQQGHENYTRSELPMRPINPKSWDRVSCLQGCRDLNPCSASL